MHTNVEHVLPLEELPGSSGGVRLSANNHYFYTN